MPSAAAVIFRSRCNNPRFKVQRANMAEQKDVNSLNPSQAELILGPPSRFLAKWNLNSPSHCPLRFSLAYKPKHPKQHIVHLLTEIAIGICLSVFPPRLELHKDKSVVLFTISPASTAPGKEWGILLNICSMTDSFPSHSPPQVPKNWNSMLTHFYLSELSEVSLMCDLAFLSSQNAMIHLKKSTLSQALSKSNEHFFQTSV